MCAQYTVRVESQKWLRRYGVPIRGDLEAFDKRVVPYTDAPVLVHSAKSGREFEIMRFSLVPSWSKEPKVKFATHNARLETILEKPTWKRPFLTRRCLVPMDRFIEPIYTGDYAGFMVRFADIKEDLLTAAGIWDVWTDKKTGEVLESFSIVTDDPPNFIEKTGHDRCPVFLSEKSFDEWLDPENDDGPGLVRLLKKHVARVDFSVNKDRAMKPGWEKRK